MIILKTLKWDDCFSYAEDNVINLAENNLTQLIGFNGYGKSSIPLIIEEALYNKNSKGIKKADVPNRDLARGYKIEIEILKDTDTYLISVDRTKTLKVRLSRNGEDISSHTATGTYKTLQEILGMDFKTFTQLVYQHPDSSLGFLTATDTNRKKFLIDLLNLQSYVEKFEIFKQKSKEVYESKIALTSKINTVASWLESNNLEDTTPQVEINLEIEKEVDEEEIGRITSEISFASEKNKKIVENNKYKELLDKIDIKEFQGVDSDHIESYDELQETRGDLSSQIQVSKRLIDKLSKLEASCHVCGQDVDVEFNAAIVEKEKAKVKQLEEEVREITQKISTIQTNNAKIQKRLKLQREWEELYRSIDHQLTSTPVNTQALQSRLKGLRGRLEEYHDEVERVRKHNAKVAEHNNRVKVILEQKDKMEKDLASYKLEMKEVEELYGDLELLKKAFSTNGLLAYKIENLVQDLEGLVNTYLAELSDGRFTLEFEVVQDKLNIVITDEGKAIDILSLSSGEMAKVNTATLLAIRKLMNSISKSKINVLFLDEVISVLDEAGKERLVEVLLREEELNTYLVSHGWAHPLVPKIEITREDKVSRIQT